MAIDQDSVFSVVVCWRCRVEDSLKGGSTGVIDIWYYNGNSVEVINSCNYSEIVFSSGGSFRQAAITLARKALRSLNSLMSLVNYIKVPVNTMLNSVYAYVLSVLNYSVEIWGSIKSEVIERVHGIFCTLILNVKNTTVCLVDVHYKQNVIWKCWNMVKKAVIVHYEQ